MKELKFKFLNNSKNGIVLTLISVLFVTLLSWSVYTKSEVETGKLKEAKLPVRKISFATWGNPKQREILKLVAQQFYALNKIQVDVYCYSDMQSCASKVITQFAAGDPFDVFYADDFSMFNIIKRDWLMDLTDFQNDKRIKSEDYYEKAYKKGIINNRLFGIPVGINPMLIYYNVNLFKEIGIADLNDIYKKGDWNQEQLISVCKLLKERKNIYGMSIKDDWATIFSIINNNEGKVYGFDNEGNVIVNKEAQESINKFNFLINNNYCIYMGDIPKGVTEDELFKSEKVAMVYADYEYAFLFKDITDFQWDIIPFPSRGKGCSASAMNIPIMCAAKNTKQVQAVKDFILFYTGAQGQKIRLEKGEKSLPSLKYTVYLNTNDMVMPEHSNYYFFSLDEGFTEPIALNYLKNREKLYIGINDFWMGRRELNSVFKLN